MRVAGEFIRYLREQRGWSLGQLSERCGIHRQRLSVIERKQLNLTIRTLERLARALGVKPRDLLRDDEADELV